MGADDKRREARYKASVPVKMIRGKDIVALRSEDVSFRGVFVKMQQPPELRQLVRVEVELPEGPTLKVHAMVVYRVAPGAEAVAGAGMQFYGLEGRERAQWDTFVQGVRDLAAPRVAPEPPATDAAGVERATGTPPPDVGSDRRAFERHAVRFEVRVMSVDELQRLYTRDISRGGMALETEMDLDPGTDVGLDLVHPRSEATFTLEATVRRHIRQGATRGLAVEFKGMTKERREELERFIAAGGHGRP